jgi:hypothetical protein
MKNRRPSAIIMTIIGLFWAKETILLMNPEISMRSPL